MSCFVRFSPSIMLYSPKLFVRDPWVLIPLSLSIVFQLLSWWYPYAHIHASAGQIFLHYTSLFGVDLVGEWWKIFYLPVGGLVIVLVNFTVSFLFYRMDKFLSRFLCIFTLLIEIFLTIAIWLIVGLNI